MKKLKKMTAGIVALALAGCAAPEKPELNEDDVPAVNRFSVALYKNVNHENENTVTSPLSALFALGMVANGADGETLTQIEEATGLDTESLNRLASYFRDDDTFHVANSMWLKEGFEVKDKNFKKTLQSDYDAEVFEKKFNRQAVDEVNGWVNDKTQGLIEKLVDDVPSSTVMILLNALAFDGAWQIPYEKEAVEKGVFTDANGRQRDAEFMNSVEDHYITMDDLHGFVKPYENGKYGFVALVPQDGKDLDEVINDLDADKLDEAIRTAEGREVYASLPKFDLEKKLELTEPLEKMGVTDLFTDNADLSKIGSGLYVSEMVQKSRIIVDEKGTKAVSATETQISETALAPDEPAVVDCNVPFLFLVMDLEDMVPLFMGTVQVLGD